MLRITNWLYLLIISLVIEDIVEIEVVFLNILCQVNLVPLE